MKTFYLFLGLLIYLIVMLAIGVFTQKYMKSLGDFLLGGRKLGSTVIAFSERASGESAWFILGLPGFAYTSCYRRFSELDTRRGEVKGEDRPIRFLNDTRLLGKSFFR